MDHSRMHYGKALLLLLATVLPASSVLADNHAGCGDPATALLIVANFNCRHADNAGIAAISGLKPADPNIAEGLNVLIDGGDIPALVLGRCHNPTVSRPNSIKRY